jgi:tetratricopeptide (TPR) repeat protein
VKWSLNYFDWNRIAAGMVFMLALAGCSSNQSKAPDYAMQTDIDTSFAQGAGRAPTPRTLYHVAVALASQGRDAEAHHVLTRLIATYPDYPPAYAEMAGVHLRHDRFEEAKAALEAGLALKGEDPVLLNNMGMCHLIEQDYSKALECFDKAQQAAPHNARYQANRALAMGLMGDYDRCLETYMTVMPPSEAHYNLAVICEARNDHERAAQEYAQARVRGGENLFIGESAD